VEVEVKAVEPKVSVLAAVPPVAMFTERADVAEAPTILTVPVPVSLAMLKMPVLVFVRLMDPDVAAVLRVKPLVPANTEVTDVVLVEPIKIVFAPVAPVPMLIMRATVEFEPAILIMPDVATFPISIVPEPLRNEIEVVLDVLPIVIVRADALVPMLMG
jgi:hypothetical protein